MRNGESTSKYLSIKCLLITKGKKGKESLPSREGWQKPSKPRDQMSEHHQKWDGFASRVLSEDRGRLTPSPLRVPADDSECGSDLKNEPSKAMLRDTQQNNGLGSSKESGSWLLMGRCFWTKKSEDAWQLGATRAARWKHLLFEMELGTSNKRVGEGVRKSWW